MHRLLALLIPFAVLAANAPRGASSGAPNPAELGKVWTASVTAETGKDIAAAMQSMQSYQKQGGDIFLSSLRLGWLHYQNADYVKSEQAYAKAQALKPTAINALLGLLNAVQAQQDIRKTNLAAEAILRVQPTNYRALMVVAGLHFAQKDYRKASSAYGRVLVNYPDDPDALSGTAWSALRIGDKDSALTIFTLLLSMSPEYPSAQVGYDMATGKVPVDQ